MKIRLMQSDGNVRHEFDLPENEDGDIDAGTILKRGDQYYVYNDSGSDEDGLWEEWIPAKVVEVQFTIGG